MHRTAEALAVRENSNKKVKICNFSMELFGRMWYGYGRAEIVC